MSDHKALCNALSEVTTATQEQRNSVVEAIATIKAQRAWIAELEQSTEFSKRRFDQLSAAQANMRDPERTMVCDILANGFLLSPPTPHDRYTIKPDARIAELESALTWQPMRECPQGPVLLTLSSGRQVVWYEKDSYAFQNAVAWLPIPEFKEPKP